MQSARHHRLVNGLPDPHGNIEAFRKEVDLFVGRSQLDLDIRIELQKMANDRSDVGRCKQHRRPNFQQTGHLAANIDGFISRFNDRSDRRSDALVEYAPGFRGF